MSVVDTKSLINKHTSKAKAGCLQYGLHATAKSEQHYVFLNCKCFYSLQYFFKRNYLAVLYRCTVAHNNNLSWMQFVCQCNSNNKLYTCFLKASVVSGYSLFRQSSVKLAVPVPVRCVFNGTLLSCRTRPYSMFYLLVRASINKH